MNWQVVCIFDKEAGGLGNDKGLRGQNEQENNGRQERIIHIRRCLTGTGRTFRCLTGTGRGCRRWKSQATSAPCRSNTIIM
jgi:hypothetical protein